MNITMSLNLYFVVETRKRKIVKLKTWMCQKLWEGRGAEKIMGGFSLQALPTFTPMMFT